MPILRLLIAAVSLLVLSPLGAVAKEWSAAAPWLQIRAGGAVSRGPVRAVKPLRPGAAVYEVCDDQMKVLARGIAKAKANGKLLIVTIGATWCPWCAALQRAMPGPEFFAHKGDKLDWRATFDHIEVVVSTLHKGRNTIVRSGMATEQFLRARSGGVEIKSIPFIVVLDPNQPDRVFARNSMDISNMETGKQDMALFRKLILEGHDFLKGSGK
ncbi:MAG: hypothetical protein R3D67_18210 [Hyphomicrobiaceae bacterium]